MNVRRELITTIFSAWLVGAIGGTILTLLATAILERSAFGLILLPIAIPLAIVASVVPLLLGMTLAALFPITIARHRKALFMGRPIVLTLACATSEFVIFVFVDAAIAGWWCYSLTGHLAEGN